MCCMAPIQLGMHWIYSIITCTVKFLENTKMFKKNENKKRTQK